MGRKFFQQILYANVEHDPLTLTAQEANVYIKIITNSGNSTQMPAVKYRTSSTADWTAYTLNQLITLSNPGDYVQFYNGEKTFSTGVGAYFTIDISGSTAAHGNVQSLLNYSQSCNDYCFFKLFSDNGQMISAPELPATVLAPSCYQNMFFECSALAAAPELPATTLAVRCYRSMFYSCTGLAVAPELPATTLAEGCYWQMFSECTRLASAPDLVATTLASRCYQAMFSGCSRLNNVRTSATIWGDESLYATYVWLKEVSSQGTFYKPAALPVEYGTSRIPEGWTVVNID